MYQTAPIIRSDTPQLHPVLQAMELAMHVLRVEVVQCGRVASGVLQLVAIQTGPGTVGASRPISLPRRGEGTGVGQSPAPHAYNATLTVSTYHRNQAHVALHPPDRLGPSR